MTTEAELGPTHSMASITDEDGHLQEKVLELQASFNGQFIPAPVTVGTPVTTQPSSPQRESTREHRNRCLQWPDHLVLISVTIFLIFFWMLPCNIISLVYSIIAVRAHRQGNDKQSRRYACISKVILLVTIIMAALILTATLVVTVGILPRVTQGDTE